MRRVGLLVLLAMAGICGEARAAPVTLYSSMCVVKQEGDIVGLRIAILDFPDANYVFFQTAEGALEAPQIVKLPRRVIAGSKIVLSKLEFPLTTQGKEDFFHGTVSQTAINGSFRIPYYNDAGKNDVRIPRAPASAQPMPNCRK